MSDRTGHGLARSWDYDRIVVPRYSTNNSRRHRGGKPYFTADKPPLTFIWSFNHISQAQVVQQIVYLSELPNLAHIKINLAIPPLYTDMDIWTFKSQMLTCFDNAWKVLETRKHKKSKSLVIRTWPGSRYPVFNHYLNDIITLVSRYV